MFVRRRRRGSSAIPADWSRRIRRITRAQLGFDPVLLRGHLPGGLLIAAVRALGGAFTPIGKPRYWQYSRSDRLAEGIPLELIPDLVAGETHLHDFVGFGLLQVGAERCVVARIHEQMSSVMVDEATVFAVRGRDAGLRLVEELETAVAGFREARLEVYGGSRSRVDVREVREEDVILPGGLREDVLGYVDAFWRGSAVVQRLRIAPGRGILLVGAPGTGKTLVVRHLLSRTPGVRRFVYASDPADTTGETSFSHMVNAVAASTKPAIVVVEDVDRLFDSGKVSPEYFLNVLDGLFQPRAPVLWLATSNDPTGLEHNILDRPGRFDRVFVFPLPERPERERLLTRYSIQAIAPGILARATLASDGLSGAHLKEACYSATLAAELREGDYPQCLLREIDRVADQHARSRRYGAEIRRERGVGFGGRRPVHG